MKMKLIGSMICLVFVFTSCSDNGKQDIKAYYYPVEALKENPLVYEYRPLNNDTLGSEFWYFQTQETDTATYLIGSYYDRNYEVRQLSTEEVLESGTVQKDYFLFIYDTLGYQQRINAAIEYPNVFPFEVRDSTEAYLQKMKWTFQEAPPVTTTLTRLRRYKGKSAYRFKGEEYDCVEFKVNELMDDFNNGHLEKEYSGKELYAKGLGLVYYKKDIDGLLLEYELIDTFPLDSLELRYQRILNEQQ